ncbi:MAG TPA: hypothetical protein VK809_03080 [Bacteroidia bacterium]|jgi:hypothetical protein|nr:hypothetical protein [Bacteroidia bacterium]
MNKQNSSQSKASQSAKPESKPASHRKSVSSAHSGSFVHKVAKAHKAKDAAHEGILSKILNFPRKLWRKFS